MSLPLRCLVEKTVDGVEIHWIYSKEKVNVDYPFIFTTPWSSLPGVVGHVSFQCMGQIEVLSILLGIFFTPWELMGFHWSLSDNKSPQVSGTPLSILADLTITIGKTVSFMFHSFFNSLVRSSYLSFFSHSFNLTLWTVGTTKSTILQVLFFCCCWLL